MTLLNGTKLTTFEVAPDGGTVSINVEDKDSKPGSLVLAADCLRMLIMTLPEMMRQSLRRRYRDPSLQLVYPLDTARLDGSTEPGKFILTLSTSGGFDVSFAITAAQMSDIADQAAAMRRSELIAAVPLRN